MTPPTFLLALGLALLSAGAARADREIPIEVSADGSPTTSAIFRNELTDVVVKEDTSAPPTFDNLYHDNSGPASSVVIRQKLGDQIVLEQSSTIGTQRADAAPLGPVANGDTTSTYNVMAASWKPAAPVTLRFSDTTDQNLSATVGTDPLIMESRRFEADWQAAGHTRLSLASEDDRNFDYGASAYDLHHNTGLTVSQLLGKSDVTWNVTPSWEEDTTGGEWASTQAGRQLNTSFDWKQAEGAKWSVGGGWNQMSAIANAVEQSTHALFVAYDRALSQRVKMLVRTDYSDQTSPRSLATPAAEQELVSLQMGQQYTVSETLSAQLDVRHSFQQDNRDAWATSESMATFSLKKSF